MTFQSRNRQLKKEYAGESPNVFVGRYGYPHIRVGLLGTQKYDQHDEPERWARENKSIQEIAGKRAELINSYFKASIKSSRERLLDLTSQVSLAKKPVQIDVSLKHKPRFRLTPARETQPHGPNVQLERASVTANPKIDWRVDKASSATDLKSSDAIIDLQKKGVSPYYLQKTFSMGNFGLPTERKLVPTRWSITAVDDILGKRMLEWVRQYSVAGCRAYFGGHYGNYYLLLFFDDVWQYELHEHHLSSKQSWMDYEPYRGRTSYAKETAGGYYAARLPILEHLHKRRRQSAVLAIRVITDEYTMPLGVWVCREAVKKALAAGPVKFQNRKEMIRHARSLMREKFSWDLPESIILRELFGQKKLSQY